MTKERIIELTENEKSYIYEKTKGGILMIELTQQILNEKFKKATAEKDIEIQQLADHHFEFLQDLAKALNLKLNKDLTKAEKEIIHQIKNK